MNKFVSAALAAVLLACCLGLGACRQQLSRTFFTMDTVCTLTLYDGTSEVLDGAVALCNTLGENFNCHSETGELSLLNRQGKLENASSDLLAVLQKGLYYSELSGGVFDITVGAVTALWDFKNQTLPEEEALAAALKTVGYQNVQISNTAVQLKNGAQIDLGSIAKGYIADRLRDYFLQNGVQSALINLGGNVYALGQYYGQPFLVGIQQPFENTVAATLEVSNSAVVTSGTYQRGFTQNGTYYHHLLSAFTGMPVRNGMHSVTVLASNSVDADALSTLCFLYGQRAIEFVNGLQGVEAVLVDEKNQITVSSGLLQNGSTVCFKNS